MSDDRLREHIRGVLPDISDDDVEDLARVVGRVVLALGPERVYLFGSQATRAATPESDYDLLVVVEHAAQPSYRLAQAAYHAAAPHRLSLDIVVMPHEEFERRSRAASSLPATVLREGRVLYAA